MPPRSAAEPAALLACGLTAAQLAKFEALDASEAARLAALLPALQQFLCAGTLPGAHERADRASCSWRLQQRLLLYPRCSSACSSAWSTSSACAPRAAAPRGLLGAPHVPRREAQSGVRRRKQGRPPPLLLPASRWRRSRLRRRGAQTRSAAQHTGGLSLRRRLLRQL
jgi:hypothetical protein